MAYGRLQQQILLTMATFSELTTRHVLVGLVLASMVMLALVVRPFATALFVAAVVAGMLAPLHLRMTRRLRNKPKIAATSLVGGVLLIILAPIGGLAAYAVKEASDGYQYVTETVRSEGMNGLIAKLPDRMEQAVGQALERMTAAKPGSRENGSRKSSAFSTVTDQTT